MNSNLAKCLILFLAVLGPRALKGGDWSSLPDWTQPVLASVDLEKPPADADLWRLLDETEILLKKDGRFEQRRRILQYVVRETGAEEAGIFIIDGDEATTRIKKLRGWHVNSRGKSERLDRDNVVTVGFSNARKVSTATLSMAQFERVTRGSMVAFESREFHESFFSVNFLSILSEFPTAKRVIRLSSEAGVNKTAKIIPLHFEGWDLASKIQGNSIEIEKIPGLADEFFSPDAADSYPMVLVGFLDTTAADEPLASWNNMAKWYYRVFSEASGFAKDQGAAIADGAALKEIAASLETAVSYRQHYLTQARGWVPQAGAEVDRLAYGDCKDMVSCLAYRGAKSKIAVLPVLANIADGSRTNAESVPSPLFNHLIAAIPLANSLGLAAEIEAGGKRFLLFDPTSKSTPLGLLPWSYRDRKVMICSPEGALWIAIPDSALEAAELTVIMRGRLDKAFTFSGTIEMIESGNSHGLRSIHKDGNRRDLEWRIRSMFDLPGVAELTWVSNDLDSSNQLQVIYQVLWPSFLHRDSGGLRLPAGITGYSKSDLSRPDHERQLPIEWSERPSTNWLIEINSVFALTPGIAQWQLDGEYNGYLWQSNAGNNLKVSYSTKRRGAHFGKGEIAAGLAAWSTFRQNFNQFYLDGAIFYAQ